ncbi:MAG: heme biosynthesis protein HemY [Xanthobacteraceae bacterium]|nr:heme biosynthesis protein HemY [Xanthobacteraceae bacterium]
MIRVVIYLVIVGVLAAGAVWLADRPGDVLITWQGRPIKTYVSVLVYTMLAGAVLISILFSVFRAIWRSPETLRLHLRMRRGVRGYHAVSQGLIAVGSGDVRAARRYADEAARIAPNEPLTLLLAAQASQLSGDRDAAERTFNAMAARDDTRLLGLHGLYIEAQRRNDAAGAKVYAEEAAGAVRAPSWAGLAVFDARCAAGDWVGALERLDRNMKSGLVDRDSYRRQRAVLLTARALETDARDDRDGARALALEAVKFAPTLVPAAALAGRLLGEARETRRAARIVEAAWKANPHPDLAEAYAYLQTGASARDRLRRVEMLAEKTPGNTEGALAVARAALDAQEFAVARRVLAPLAIAPSQRVAMLMAELEEKEHGDEGRAREWMTRALRARLDPAWTADGIRSERWMPVSPVTGRLDAFQWKDPIANLGVDDALIEHLSESRPPVAAPPPAPPVTEIKPLEAKPVEAKPVDAPPAAPPTPSASSAGRGLARTAATAAPIVPLIHVPDDPGPDPQPQLEPETETSNASGESWRKLRGLFK